MTRKEMKKILVVEKVIDHQLTVREGADLLELSTRQLLRLKNRYLTEGAQGIVHKNRGRRPAHALSDDVKKQVVDLYRNKYYGSNNCHFAELLEEHESLKLSPSSVRRILLAEGLKQNKQRRRHQAHRPRNRRSQAGMLWQIDASPYDWLEGRGPHLTLHGAIDDATGLVTGAAFRLTETQEGYFTVMRQGIESYGIPLGLYSDKHTIFRSPNEKLSVAQELAGEHMPLSQFGKAMADLDITHIKAMTPQAKGRIERLWGVFQDRMVIELRLLGVSTLAEANEVLPKLIERHNDKFAVAPKEDTPAYRPLEEDTDLTYVFVVREQRQIGSGQTVSYDGKLYTLATRDVLFEPRTLVEVRRTMAGDVVIFHQGRVLPLREVQKQQRKAVKKSKKASAAPSRKPAENHPWKNQRKKQVQHSTDKREFQEAMYSQHNSYADLSW